MAERTIIESMAGTTVAISASLPATYDAAGYGATTITYTAIGNIESIGPHGMSAAVTEFTPIDTAVVTKVKGSKNYGNIAIVAAYMPSDTGQDIVETASESNSRYSVKITYQDTSIHYLDVLVSTNEIQDGAVNDVQKRTFEFAICRKPIIVAQV